MSLSHVETEISLDAAKKEKGMTISYGGTGISIGFSNGAHHDGNVQKYPKRSHPLTPQRKNVGPLNLANTISLHYTGSVKPQRVSGGSGMSFGELLGNKFPSIWQYTPQGDAEAFIYSCLAG